jgi:predicted transcriptional regulator
VKTVPVKKAAVRKTAPPTASDNIFQIIKKSKKGINTKDLIKITGYDKKSVSDAIYKLTKQGKIKTVSKGVYIKA